MKRLVIQYNFFSGLGDLFCGMTEVSNYVFRAKSLGYEVSLVFCLHSGSGPMNKYIDDVKVEEVFDKKWLESTFDHFETRQRSTHLNKLLGCLNHPKEKSKTAIGHNQWDIFFNKFPEPKTPEYSLLIPESYSTSRIVYRNPPLMPFPTIFPKFVSEVYKRRDKFLFKNPKEFSFLQLRYHDLGSGIESRLDSRFKLVCEKTREALQMSERNFLLGSNEAKWIEYQSNLPNIFTYSYKDLDLYTNNHNYYLIAHNKISHEKLYDRMLDNLAEMVSLEYAKDFFSCTVFGWVSSFMFYALCMKKHNKIPFTFYKLNLYDKPLHNFLESLDFLYKKNVPGETIN